MLDVRWLPERLSNSGELARVCQAKWGNILSIEPAPNAQPQRPACPFAMALRFARHRRVTLSIPQQESSSVSRRRRRRKSSSNQETTQVVALQCSTSKLEGFPRSQALGKPTLARRRQDAACANLYCAHGACRRSSGDLLPQNPFVSSECAKE